MVNWCAFVFVCTSTSSVYVASLSGAIVCIAFVYGVALYRKLRQYPIVSAYSRGMMQKVSWLFDSCSLAGVFAGELSPDACDIGCRLAVSPLYAASPF